jgi:hypothetical protein
MMKLWKLVVAMLSINRGLCCSRAWSRATWHILSVLRMNGPPPWDLYSCLTLKSTTIFENIITLSSMHCNFVIEPSPLRHDELHISFQDNIIINYKREGLFLARNSDKNVEPLLGTTWEMHWEQFLKAKHMG